MEDVKWLIRKWGAPFLIFVMTIVIGCVVFLSRNNEDRQEDLEQFALDGGELLVSLKEGYNSVEIYKQGDILVICAESESAFFDTIRLTVEPQGDISPENVEIIWTTLGGGTERTEDNDFMIAEIKITENKSLIFDRKINFAKKAFDAVEDVLQGQIK